jgi:anti-sigma B factor antagonist
VPDVQHPLFEIELESYGSTLFVRLIGEFDLASHDQFERAVDGHDGSPPRAIVLDLQGLTFIDSTGLRVIVALWERSLQEGFDFAIVPGSTQVQRAFALTGLDGVLPMAEEITP